MALQLPPELHEKLATHSERVALKRGDFVCYLVETYAADVQVTDVWPNGRP
jgi:hypothetical protein